ncbi:MAG: hypothetical protein WC782_08635 [Methylococcaceae bacterium]|jgi:hypothetical protein
MKLYVLLFSLLIGVSPALHAAFTTSASATAVVGGSAFPRLSPFVIMSDDQSISHINSASQANASIFDQAFDAETDSGLLFRRQAISSASASPGVLKSFASAGYFIGRFHGNNFGVAGTSRAEFTDTFSVFGPGLTSKVNLEFKLTGALQGLASVAGGTAIDFLGNKFTVNASESIGSPLAIECPGFDNCTGKITVVVPNFVDITLSGFLTTLAAANSDPNRNLFGDAIANYANTGRIFLSAVDPRSHITTSSGFDYSPVPLPASVWLFGSVLLVMLAQIGAHRFKIKPLA